MGLDLLENVYASKTSREAVHIRPLTPQNLYFAQRGKCFFCCRMMAPRSVFHPTLEAERELARLAKSKLYYPGWTVDHLYPKVYGYILNSNQVLSCEPCNRAKASKLPDEAMIGKAIVLYASVGAVWAPHKGVSNAAIRGVAKRKRKQIARLHKIEAASNLLHRARDTSPDAVRVVDQLLLNQHTRFINEQKSLKREERAKQWKLKNENIQLNPPVQGSCGDSQELPHEGGQTVSNVDLHGPSKATRDKCWRSAQQAWSRIASTITQWIDQRRK